MSTVKYQEVKAGGVTYEVRCSAKQRLNFRGRYLNLEAPDAELLKAMAETKGSLVRVKGKAEVSEPAAGKNSTK